MKEPTAAGIQTTVFSIRKARVAQGLLVALATSSLLVACGSDVVDFRIGGASASSSTGAGEEACESTACSTPPAVTCVSATTLRTYDDTGACAAGVCSYGYVDTLCPSGCSGGMCSAVVNPMGVSTALMHSCAVTEAGAVKCWGSNIEGRLGNYSKTDSPVPVDVVGLSSGVLAVAAGSSHSCAVTFSGAVKCWGRNVEGQLGASSTANSPVPVDVVGLSSGVVSLSSGSSHTCAVTSTGAVKCWGWNAEGQLGINSMTDSPVPVDVVGLSSGVVAVSAGGNHTCAVTSTGAVKCWGDGSQGSLGDNSKTDSPVPVDVVGLSSGVVAVSAGSEHTCAVTSSGAVKCWGWNASGQLGMKSTTDSLVPVDVMGLSSGVVAVSTGYVHTCAVTSVGAVKCWGGNFLGQLGNNSSIDSPVPVDVVGLSSGVVGVSAGAGYTCACTKAGAVKCWGPQLDGTNPPAYSPVPVDVMGL